MVHYITILKLYRNTVSSVKYCKWLVIAVSNSVLRFNSHKKESIAMAWYGWNLPRKFLFPAASSPFIPGFLVQLRLLALIFIDILAPGWTDHINQFRRARYRQTGGLAVFDQWTIFVISMLYFRVGWILLADICLVMYSRGRSNILK